MQDKESQVQTKEEARALYQNKANQGIALRVRDLAVHQAAMATIEEWRLNIEGFPAQKIQEQSRFASAWAQVAARAGAAAEGRHDVFQGNPDEAMDGLPEPASEDGPQMARSRSISSLARAPAGW